MNRFLRRRIRRVRFRIHFWFIFIALLSLSRFFLLICSARERNSFSIFCFRAMDCFWYLSARSIRHILFCFFRLPTTFFRNIPFTHYHFSQHFVFFIIFTSSRNLDSDRILPRSPADEAKPCHGTRPANAEKAANRKWLVKKKQRDSTFSVLST